MRRSPLELILSLTWFVGILPFVSVGSVLWLAVNLGAVDDGWGILFGVAYLAATYVGAQAFASRLERF